MRLSKNGRGVTPSRVETGQLECFRPAAFSQHPPTSTFSSELRGQRLILPPLPTLSSYTSFLFQKVSSWKTRPCDSSVRQRSPPAADARPCACTVSGGPADPRESDSTRTSRKSRGTVEGLLALTPDARPGVRPTDIRPTTMTGAAGLSTRPNCGRTSQTARSC